MITLFPVETYVTGLILDTMRFYYGWEGSGNTLQYGFVTPLFFQLKLLPALLYLLSGIGGGISEYVWMAVNQFLAKAVADILDIESFFFLADLGVKDDVQ